MLKETFENTVLTAFIQNHVASLYINNLNIVNNMEIYAVIFTESKYHFYNTCTSNSTYSKII